ncbi:MAG: hypothetical protein U0Q21_04865 [Dermatophilaceae bacterium]
MGEDYLSMTSKTCRECGQLVAPDRGAEAGESGDGAELEDLDWTEFCPSPNCPAKSEA